MFLSQLPGFNEAYAKAVALDAESRDAAYLDLPQSICGIDVEPVTLRQLVRLMLVRTPFLCAGEIQPEDIANFLWHISPHYLHPYKRGLDKGSAMALLEITQRRKEEFTAEVMAVPAAAAVKEIHEYLDETFFDAPSGGGTAASNGPMTSFAENVIGIIASNYHWTEDAILDRAMVRNYQSIRHIIQRNNPKAIIANRRVDKVKGDFLRALNATAEVCASGSVQTSAQPIAPIPPIDPIPEKEAT